jgi:hypothetical protein
MLPSSLLFLFLLFLQLPFVVFACFSTTVSYDEEGNVIPASKMVTIGTSTSVCVVINDRYISVIEPLADEYSRLVFQNSFSEVMACDPFWIIPPNSCLPLSGTQSPSIQGQREASEGRITGTQTTIYMESMGVKSNYKKLFASSQREFFFPILTTIITVAQGVVTSVTWDDGCYFCADSTAQEQLDPTTASQSGCKQNAFNMVNSTTFTPKELAPLGSEGGMDCGLSQSDCLAQVDSATAPIPDFCDLALYVVWSGA